MLQYIRCEKGLTLIEVLVAITILGIAVVGLMGMFSTANSTYIGAGKETVALNLAQQVIEELRSKSWDSIKNVKHAPVGGNYYSLDVEEMGNVKKVRVTVTYQKGSSLKELVLETRISAR